MNRLSKSLADHGTDGLLIIEPGRSERNYWTDMWRYRELFGTLAWRDISVRYKQTLIGFAWAVVRPFVTMAIFTIVFGRIANLPSDGGSPYALMVFSAMMPWTLFSTSLIDVSNSLVANSNLVTKVYFPRLIVPTATFMVGLVDFGISAILLVGLMLYYGFMPGIRLLLLPAFILVAILASLGPGIWISAINVKYRDFRYAIPFITQLGLYISPVGFSSSVIPDQWRFFYSLNPMVGVIDGFRWCVLGGSTAIYVPGFLASLAVTVLLLWLGVVHFRKQEKQFADLI